MFTRAGFNARSAHVTAIRARVAVRDGGRRGVAHLVIFRGGDMAWYSRNNFLIWGSRAHFIDFIHQPFASLRGFPSSSVDEPHTPATRNQCPA